MRVTGQFSASTRGEVNAFSIGICWSNMSRQPCSGARMGVDRLDAHQIANYGPAAFEELFREVPALHRFPAAMAKRMQDLCRALVDQYEGDAATIWNAAATGHELVPRIAGPPGFGQQKAAAQPPN
jgi:uncharacterized HhH-GPD family protein